MAMELVPSLQCDSYPPGTWVLTYQFNSGVQDGISYSGNSRNAVLPNTKEGREILRLFIRAFYRRHIFKIGDSITNGTTDTVVWAGIHHKSNVSGGPAQFGFPDPTYFSRVKEELAARGVS
jgi:deltex-like protein